MCYEVKRKVERRNADHWPARHPADLGGASFVARQPIQRDNFAIDAFRFFGRDFEGKTGAFDFSARGLDWFAGFQRNCTRQLFFARHDAGANLLQHFAPLPRRHSACGGKGRYGCCDRLLDCVGSGAVDDGDQGIVVWAAHFDSITGMVMLAIDQIAIFAQFRLASAVGARRVVTRVAESLDGCHRYPLGLSCGQLGLLSVNIFFAQLVAKLGYSFGFQGMDFRQKTVIILEFANGLIVSLQR